MSGTMQQLKGHIQRWAKQLGFDAVGISDTDLSVHESYLQDWLHKNYHGDMAYMYRHGNKRSRPSQLVAGTTRIISVRMNYYPPGATDSWQVINSDDKGFISRYALGRDYHKVMRKRLQRLAEKIQVQVGEFA